MANYNETQNLLDKLNAIIDKRIEQHPLIKAAVKARKAIVWEAPDTEHKTVKIMFPADVLTNKTEPLTFPYNPQMESYLMAATPKVTTISIWWYMGNISNGTIMQNGEWSI